MKKIMVGILSLGLLFGIASTVTANSFDDGFPSFEEMLPFMQKMHPNWENAELEAMYNTCHGENRKTTKNMMKAYMVD